jgi:hypothetical protein
MREYINLMERANVAENPAFQAWFKGSKVVDKQGQPLVCYHGTFRDFATFKHHAFGSAGSGFNRLGFWFDVSPDTANYFAGYHPETGPATGANVKPCFLSIKRPLAMSGDWLWDEDLEELRDLAQKLKTLDQNDPHNDYYRIRKAYDAKQKEMLSNDAWTRVMNHLPDGVKSKTEDVAAFQQQLISEGYDGIHLIDTMADGGSRGYKPTDWWIAFYPQQIKSVFNQTFDPDSDEI